MTRKPRQRWEKRDCSFSARKKGWYKWLTYCSNQQDYSCIKKLSKATLGRISRFLAHHLNPVHHKRGLDRVDRKIEIRLGKHIRHHSDTKHLSINQLELFYAYVSQTSKTRVVKDSKDANLWNAFAEALREVISGRKAYEAGRERETRIYKMFGLDDCPSYGDFLKGLTIIIDEDLNPYRYKNGTIALDGRRYLDKSFEMCATILNSLPEYCLNKIKASYIKTTVNKKELLPTKALFARQTP